MIDERELLEQALRSFEPEPGLTDRVYRRRDRKRRDKRIAAGVVGIAVFVAAVWVVTTAGSLDGTTTPADKPPVSPAEDVATDFLHATAVFNPDQAVSYLADNADLSGLGVEGPGQFRLLIAFNEATHFEAIGTSCEEWDSSPSFAYVRCTYDFYGLRSQEIGRGPYSGNYIDITVSDGHIVRAALYPEFGKFSRQMWDPFAEWVTTNYPEDAAVMYDENQTDWFNAHLTPRSIRLWERHTREYVETRSAETGPAETSDDGWDGNGFRIPPAGTAVSTPLEGELVVDASVGVGGFIRVYADGRMLSAKNGGGIIVERRLSPEGVELMRQVLGELVEPGYGVHIERLESLLGNPRLSSGDTGESAWEDREGKLWVPARYGACFWYVDLPLDAEAVSFGLNLLPASAQALLRGSAPVAWNPRCLEVTPEEARSLEEILSEARSSRGDPWAWEVGAWSLRDGNGDQLISIRPLFPDGRRVYRVPF